MNYFSLKNMSLNIFIIVEYIIIIILLCQMFLLIKFKNFDRMGDRIVVMFGEIYGYTRITARNS